MSLILGFVKYKVSLSYKTYKESKMSTRRGGEERRAEASTSHRGWARPAHPHADGVLTHSMRRDAAKEDFLRILGIRLLRIPNAMVLEHQDEFVREMVETIRASVEKARK
jgi:hypothetical protein